MTFGEVVHEIFHSRELRKRILFTVFILLVFRFAAHVPVPNTNLSQLGSLLTGNQLLSIFSLLTGGGLETLSVVMLGVSPYITASIIMQLLTVIVPKWEEVSKDGERGQRVINRWTRILTVPLAFVQSYGIISLLNSQTGGVQLFLSSTPGAIAYTMFIVTAGTMLLLWLGDLITEHGIGNGISVLIFAGILAGLPGLVQQYGELISADVSQLYILVAAGLFTLAMIVFIVLITDAQRKIPLTYAGRNTRGGATNANSFLPIPVNQAGMIPIIFAVSLLALPPLLANFLQAARTPWVANTSRWVIANFTQNSPYYLVTYFVLLIAFTYFYVSVAFNPEKVAENIQKRGGFVPGYRPGRQTAEYLGMVSRRVTLLGALFIAIVALLPLAIPFIAPGGLGSTIPILVSGAGLIIVVGVVLELVRQVKAQLMMQDYEKFAA